MAWVALDQNGKVRFLKVWDDCRLEGRLWCLCVFGVGLLLGLIIASNAISQLRQWEKREYSGVFTYLLVFYIYTAILINSLAERLLPYIGLEMTRRGYEDGATPVLVSCLAFVFVLCGLVDAGIINEHSRKTLFVTVFSWVLLFYLADSMETKFRMYWKDFVGVCGVFYIVIELLSVNSFQSSALNHNLHRPSELLLAVFVLLLTLSLHQTGDDQEEKSCNCSLYKVLWFYNSSLIMHIVFLSLRFSEGVPQEAPSTSSQLVDLEVSAKSKFVDETVQWKSGNTKHVTIKQSYEYI